VKIRLSVISLWLTLLLLQTATLPAAQEQLPGSIGEVDPLVNLDPSLRFELEEALQRLDYDKAEQLLAREIEGNPDAPQHELLTYLGGLFFVNKKYLNAAVALKRAETIRPLDANSGFTLAMSFVLLGRRDWARDQLEKLAGANPGQPLFPYWLARLDYDDNHYQPAVEKLNRLVAQYPTYVRAWDRLGLCYEALGKNKEAIENYEKAIVLNRQDSEPSPWPALNLGVLLIQTGQWEEAEKNLQEAVRIDPGFAQAHYRLGLALEKLNKIDESIASLREAARLDTEYPDPHWALARLLRRAGDREGAQSAVEQYQRLKKDQKDKEKTPGS
jgi:tetratricopeptide (TPR) repeat protein